MTAKHPLAYPERTPCACGCGQYPKRKESVYLPGHDLRHAYAKKKEAAK